MKKYVLILSALAFSLGSFAQNIWTADLDAVEESGYYNIELDQRLIGGSRSDFSDLRILNSTGEKVTETPYFTRPVSPIQEVSSFENYELKENIAKDSLNVIIVDNAKKENLDRFYLVLSNAEVKIEMSIRGSNDLKQWFIVKQKTNISNYRNQQGNDAMLILDFPQGNYKYYEITLTNDQKSPLDIKRVGKMNSSSIYGQFAEVNVGRHLQKEDDKNRTLLTFPDLKDTYRISKIEFSLDTKMAYLRHTQMTDSINHVRASFQLSSKGDNVFFVDNYRLQGSTTIRVENNNNPALTFGTVKVYALKRYICAYLEKGQKYTLVVDAKKYDSPNYDIGHFQNDIVTDLPVITTNNVDSKAQPEPVIEVREQMFIEKPIVLWTIIIGVGLFLTLICVKMVKKMKEDEK